MLIFFFFFQNENKTNVSEGFTPENKSPNLSQLINESFFKNLEKGYLPWPTFLNDTSTEISFVCQIFIYLYYNV